MSAVSGPDRGQVKFFDRFTKTMLIVMLVLLLIIFASAKVMAHEHMTGTGTDDTVNGKAEALAHKSGHPFVELPGDSQVAAFSIANFFVGVILGYSVFRLFGKREGFEAAEEPGLLGVREGMKPEEGTAG